MLLSWIVKTIPRSPRALFMLVVMLGSVAMAFWGLQELFVPNQAGIASAAIRLTAGLAVGIPSAAFFYYFQMDEDRRRHEDWLSDAASRDRIYKKANYGKRHKPIDSKR